MNNKHSQIQKGENQTLSEGGEGRKGERGGGRLPSGGSVKTSEKARGKEKGNQKVRERVRGRGRGGGGETERQWPSGAERIINRLKE